MKKKMIKKLAAAMVGVMMLTCVPMQNIYADDIIEQKTEEQGNYENPELTFDTDSQNQSEQIEASEPEEEVSNQETVEEKNEKGIISQNQNKAEEKENSPVETQDEKEALTSELNYLFVNKANITSEEKQSFVISWGKEDSPVDTMELVVENEQQETKKLSIKKNVKNTYLFEDTFEQGIYHIAGLHVTSGEKTEEFTAKDLAIEAFFGVEEEYQGNEKSEHIEVESIGEEEIPEVDTNIVTIDDKGNEKTADTVKEALDDVKKARTAKVRSAVQDTRTEDLVIVLDPGHDSKHAGVQKNGVKEEVVSLKIAQYCKEELEKYGGVTVYLTREDAACPFPNSKSNIDDISKRTDWAKTKGADVFISFHINSSTSSSANGAEVYYPKGDKDAEKLAEQILDELENLGLHNRGDKADTDYAVVRHSIRNGFPGFIIEHAFVTNSSDVKWFQSETNLKKLGVADATGIAEHYGLEKSAFGLENISFDKKSPQEIGTTINMTANLKKPTEGMQYKYVWMKNNWKEWGVLKDFSKENSVTWYPKEKGTYYIYLDVKDRTGRVETISTTYKITHGEWRFEGISPNISDVKRETAILVKPSVSGAIEGLQYKFVWMRENWKEWGVLKEFSTSNECKFVPQKLGEYTLFIDIKDTDGKVITKSKIYNVVQSIWNFENIKTDLVSPQEMGVDKIQILPNVTGEIKNLQYKYVWMKDNWKEWGIIQEFSNSPIVSWKPKSSGKYMLYVDVKDSQGKVITKTLYYEIQKSKWNYKGIEVNPSKEQEVEKNVEIKAITSGNTKDLRYKFVWMKDDWKEWGVIQPFSEKNSVTWKTPKKSGTYRFYVDIKTSDGEVRTKWKDYQIVSKKWKLTGLNINNGETGKPLIAIPIKALTVGETSNLQYKFVWEQDNWKEWGVIRDFEELNYVTNWTPKTKGSFRIYVDVKDMYGRVETINKEFIVK